MKVKVDTSERSIPAWAGEPFEDGRWGECQEVCPRVGGGTSSMRSGLIWARGLSPRGRGNHPLVNEHHQSWGSIPAWAGEPGEPRLCRAGLRVYPRVGGGTLEERLAALEAAHGQKTLPESVFDAEPVDAGFSAEVDS